MTLVLQGAAGRDQGQRRCFSNCQSCQFSTLGLHGEMPTNLYEAVAFALSLTLWAPGYEPGSHPAVKRPGRRMVSNDSREAEEHKSEHSWSESEVEPDVS
jgi:hypothetical protein